MAKSIDEHVKAFDWSNIRVGSPELTVAFSGMLEDLKAARAEVERLTAALKDAEEHARGAWTRLETLEQDYPQEILIERANGNVQSCIAAIAEALKVKP